MNIFLVLCHPRRDSLTGTVADAFTKGALEAGHRVDFLIYIAKALTPFWKKMTNLAMGG